jgi:hypothetical protein
LSLIICGCRYKRGLRWKLLDDIDTEPAAIEEEHNEYDKFFLDPLASEQSSIIGTGPGSKTVENFYEWVEVIIPASNPCKLIYKD